MHITCTWARARTGESLHARSTDILQICCAALLKVPYLQNDWHSMQQSPERQAEVPAVEEVDAALELAEVRKRLREMFLQHEVDKSLLVIVISESIEFYIILESPHKQY